MKYDTVPADRYVYAMSGEHPPVLTVPPGSGLVFETCDCFHGQIGSESQSIQALDWERINPATGPVYVEGAEPGDALRIAVEEIAFTGKGVMAAIPGVGVFGGSVSQSTIRLLEVEDGRIPFGNGVNLPVRPMIGVIGTAPAGAAVPCGTPGSHGGNMDCAKIAPGSVLYLPVFHPGGLLAMGDVHACMGDGEVMGTGVEIPARVRVAVELVKGAGIQDPLLETEDMVYAVVSAESVERASARAAEEIRAMVARKLGLDRDAAGMLLSAAGSLEVCQIVDPKVTVRFGISREWAV